MTYSKLQSILPNDEIHYTVDCDQFMEDNGYDMKDYAQYEFIVFSETVDYLTDTLRSLMDAKVPFVVEYDEFNLEFILI